MSTGTPHVHLRVLSVTDDRHVSDLVSKVFGDSGDDVEALNDLASGIARSQETPPDLAFVDVTLAQRGGLALVHHIKALSPEAEVYALARPDALEAASQAVSLGASGLIVCPPSGDELLNAAAVVRARRAAARQSLELRRELEQTRRMLGYVARIGALADRGEHAEVAAAIAEVLREATGASLVLVYLQLTEGAAEFDQVARLGHGDESPATGSEARLMRFARDSRLEVLPLSTGMKAVGHILLGPPDIGGSRAPHLSVLCAQAATTLSLVLERERAARGTIKDGATSAYTFAYFVDIAGREIDKARRHSRRFALAILLSGDTSPEDEAPPSKAVDVAESVLSSVRDSDVLARVDEREFYLLLPETDGQGAHSCRRRVLGLSQQARAAAILSGVAMGVATFPHDGSDLSRLLRMARRRAEASRHSVVQRLKLARLPLPEVVDKLMWDQSLVQGKLQPGPETPRALELPMVDVIGVVRSLVHQATSGGGATVVVSNREGLGLASAVRAVPTQRADVTVHALDVKHRDGCEDLEAISVVAEQGAYALLGRVDHGMFHGVHAADPLLADIVVHRLSELSGMRVID